jgi:hypothetical protein
MKVIHQTIQPVIQTVNSLWLRRMDPRCRTGDSAHAHKFREMPESYAVISRLMSYKPLLYADSDWTASGPESDVENEDI